MDIGNDNADTWPADSRQAFVERVHRHRGIVLKVASTYASHPDDRADLQQDILAQLWRAWPGYDERRAFSTWMYRIALNVGISFLRGQQQRQRHAVPYDDSVHDAVDEHGHDHEAAEQLQLLQQFIATLAPLDRALLLLYLDDRSTREIADVLGVGDSNVTTKINRLKQRIRNYAAPAAPASTTAT
ncbi:RNA polymerase sigma factor [Luteimonas sp. RIT-PG2_3]